MLANLFLGGAVVSAGLLALTALAKRLLRIRYRVVEKAQRLALDEEVKLPPEAKGDRGYWRARLANLNGRHDRIGGFIEELRRALFCQAIASVAAYVVCVAVAPLPSVFVFVAVSWSLDYKYDYWDQIAFWSRFKQFLCLDEVAYDRAKECATT